MMTFSEALERVRIPGTRISREGWREEGMYVVYQKGYPNGIPINGNTAEATGLPQGTVVIFKPYLMLCTGQGEFEPWVISQTDALAEDWQAVHLS
jgi:hypothetical protein